MAATTTAMTKQALRFFKPEEVCLVPESLPEEVTTEGGLDMTSDVTPSRLKAVIAKLSRTKIKVSAFIDADLAQVDAAHHAGAQVIELHTGGYANAHQTRPRAARNSSPATPTPPPTRNRPRPPRQRRNSHLASIIATSASTSRMCRTCTRSTSGTRLFPAPSSLGWSKPSGKCWT